VARDPGLIADVERQRDYVVRHRFKKEAWLWFEGNIADLEDDIGVNGVPVPVLRQDVLRGKEHRCGAEQDDDSRGVIRFLSLGAPARHSD